MKCALILLVRGKVGSKKNGFFEILKLADVMLGNNVIFYKTTFINFSISTSYGLFRLLVIL
jgi:hypothetical protein